MIPISYTDDVNLQRFNPASASDSYFQARLDCLNRYRQEASPDDAPTTLAISIANAKGWAVFSDTHVEVWDLWLGNTIAAELFMSWSSSENKHINFAGLRVLAPHRRQGYAKLLLEKLLAVSLTQQHRLVIGDTTSFIPAGETFARQLGANPGLKTQVNQLLFTDVNTERLESWLTLAESAHLQDFELGSWTFYPEAELEAIAVMVETMTNDEPSGDLDIEEERITADFLRETETYFRRRGDKPLRLYLRHKPTNQLAGYTEVILRVDNPDRFSQGDTGVMPEYRGRGLAKWLKAAMIEHIRQNYPAVRSIRTNNANMNGAMLTINRALGFQPYASYTSWQLSVDTLEAYLNR